jgi:hypothetical protein
VKALQTSFVDEPRRAVEEGDTLVAELMQKLANSFAEERQSLEAQWDRGDDVSTEDLLLQRYRSFFDRLLRPKRTNDGVGSVSGAPGCTEETRPPRRPTRPRHQPTAQASVP